MTPDPFVRHPIASLIRTLHIEEAAYPAALRDLADAPQRIFLRGELSRGRRVAIVGARRSSELGRRIARTIAIGLAEAGVIVVSGGAIGADAAAHQGAIEGGGKTWVVLPTCLERPGPRRNRALFEAVLKRGGAWISETPEGPPFRSSFLVRNRLIAALCEAVVVIEAAAISGTFATARAARRLGRPLAVVPWAIGDPRGEGCLRLLEEGAAPVTSADHVLRWIGAKRRRKGAEPAGDLVGRLSRSGPASASDLASQIGRPIREILSELTRLEIEGHVALGPGGLYAVSRPGIR